MARKIAGRAHSTSRRTPTRPRPRTARPALSPTRLLQLGLGFWGPRAFLSAVELGVFSVLAKGPLGENQLRERLELHPRSARDFLDTLVALGPLQRNAGKYRNAPDADAFLDRAKPGYVGGILEMAAARLYPFWGSLTEALHTGAPQNEAKHGGDLFATLYADAERLRGFLAAMTGISMGSARAIAAKFPWKKYQSFIDVGGAQGCVPVQVILAHKHLNGAAFDLPPVGPIYDEYVRSFGLEARLKFHAGDFFRGISCHFGRAAFATLGHRYISPSFLKIDGPKEISVFYVPIAAAGDRLERVQHRTNALHLQRFGSIGPISAKSRSNTW